MKPTLRTRQISVGSGLLLLMKRSTQLQRGRGRSRQRSRSQRQTRKKENAPMAKSVRGRLVYVSFHFVLKSVLVCLFFFFAFSMISYF